MVNWFIWFALLAIAGILSDVANEICLLHEEIKRMRRWYDDGK